MSEPRPLDPDEVGYTRPGAPRPEPHNTATCQREHCACHLPSPYVAPNLELTSREALVLAWHLFPLKDDEELSFQQIAGKLGVTETRVRQIYMRAGAKLRAYPRVHYPVNPNRITQNGAGDPDHS